jgi:hypothetical protein
MKLLLYIIIFILTISCKNKTSKLKMIQRQIDSIETIKNNSSKLQSSIFLPEDYITKQEINKFVSEINKLILSGNFTSERIGGFNNGYCEIIKYFKDSSLVLIELGCGDCTNFMSNEKYYIKNKDLIFVNKNYINYGYNPCWSKETCKENGITEKLKRKILKTRNEKYYFFDMGSSFTRMGNLNDTLYVSNDTLSVEDILNDAVNYSNAKE